MLTVSATQVGKTFALAAWLLAQAIQHGNPAHPWWWLAPTYNQVVQGHRLMMSLAQGTPAIESSVMTPYPTMRLANGSVVEFRSWEREQNLMGTSIAGAVIDEAGLLSPKAQAAISTRRSSTLGPLRYIGNPGVVAGPFRRLCSLGEQAKTNKKHAGIYSFHKWTWRDKYEALQTENPARAAEYLAFIEQEGDSLPDFEFRRLYDAEWTEDEAAVFRGVADCHKPGDSSTLGTEDDKFVLGLDVAQTVDYLAAVSIGVNSRRLELRERFRGIGYPQAAQRMQGLQRALGSAPIVVEANGPGVAIIQEFDRIGVNYVPFTTTNQSKQEIVLNLAADIQNGRVSIADHPPLPYELSIFRYERTPAGLYRYSAPEGEHDDTVMAACLARHGLGHAVTEGFGWVA